MNKLAIAAIVASIAALAVVTIDNVRISRVVLQHFCDESNTDKITKLEEVEPKNYCGFINYR